MFNLNFSETLRNFLFPAEKRAGRFSILYLAAVVLIFLAIGSAAALRPVQEQDEGRYSEVAREMLLYGQWLLPHQNGVPHLSKPPLYYNLSALAIRLFGKNAFAFRFVSLAGFTAMVLAGMAWARDRRGTGSERLVLWISLSMFQPVFAAQFADLNTLLSCTVTLGLLMLFEGLDRESRAAWILGWLFLGVAFMVKGPPALISPRGTLILFRVLSGRPLNIHPVLWAAGLAVFAVVALPWYLWILKQYKGEILEFWFGDALRRTALGSSARKFHYYFYYPPVFLVMTSGWGVFMLILLARSVRAHLAPGRWPRIQATWRAVRALPHDELWLLCWLVFTILFFTLLRAHMLSYIQPAYPALAMLLALYLHRKKAHSPTVRGAVRLGLYSFAGTLVTLWILSGAGYVLVRSKPETAGPFLESIEHNIVAHRMMNEAPKDSWRLVQAFTFSPIFNLEADRMSYLSYKRVNDFWPSPPRMNLNVDEMRALVMSREPMMIVIKPARVSLMFPKPPPWLRTLYASDELVLLTTVPPRDK